MIYKNYQNNISDLQRIVYIKFLYVQHTNNEKKFLTKYPNPDHTGRSASIKSIIGIEGEEREEESKEDEDDVDLEQHREGGEKDPLSEEGDEDGEEQGEGGGAGGGVGDVELLLEEKLEWS